jgi:hypothetical protein
MKRFAKTLLCGLPWSKSPKEPANSRSVTTAAAVEATATSTEKLTATTTEESPKTTMGSIPVADPASSKTEAFLSLIEARRSIYPLNKDISAVKGGESRIREIVAHTLQHIPSSFNSQSNRAVVLFGAAHDKLWSQITTDALKAVVPAESWEPTGKKMEMFAGAAGTVLFFEDQKAIEKLQADWPTYAAA